MLSLILYGKCYLDFEKPQCESKLEKCGGEIKFLCDNVITNAYNSFCLNKADKLLDKAIFYKCILIRSLNFKKLTKKFLIYNVYK